MTTIRVSKPGDYSEGRIYIEIVEGNDSFVPAWEERGFCDLCGTLWGPFGSEGFRSVDEARALLESERDYLEWSGFRLLVEA